jgi:hypothetical protein
MAYGHLYVGGVQSEVVGESVQWVHALRVTIITEARFYECILVPPIADSIDKRVNLLNLPHIELGHMLTGILLLRNQVGQDDCWKIQHLLLFSQGSLPFVGLTIFPGVVDRVSSTALIEEKVINSV